MSNAPGPVRPIPKNTDPNETVCFKIDLPNDPQWIATYLDAVYTLTRWFAWGRDTDHTGREIAARWLQVFKSIQLCKEEQAPSGCPDPGEEYLLRQNPSNPCLIETSANGTDWCTLIDLSLCMPATGQPGSGATQPAAGGGQACYNGNLSASQQWLLPSIVNAGDVLTFSDIAGAATDGSGTWTCPDGEIFFAGACIGLQITSGSDPAPALHHMTLVAKIGAVYYDITAGPITVPGGIANAPVTIQVNDNSLSDNSGDYQFKVCVTNNQLVTWTHTFDFRTGTHGASIVPGAGGAYTPGTGFVGTNSGGGTLLRVLMNLSAAAHLTGASITFSVTNGIFPQTIFITYAGLNRTGGTLYTATDSRADGSTVTAAVDSYAFSSVATRSLMLSLDSHTPSAIDTIISMTLTGDGPEPVWS